jgi:hypothetical protein
MHKLKPGQKYPVEVAVAFMFEDVRPYFTDPVEHEPASTQEMAI